MGTDVLTSVCVDVIKMCVGKEWNLQYNSLHVVASVAEDTRAAAALFDLDRYFEASSEHRDGRFSWLKMYIW